MTIANYITISRIILIPFFVFSLHDWQTKAPDSFGYLAIILFGLIALSDWLDGFLARQLDCKSRLGEFLDPTADKLLILGTLGFLSFFESSGALKLPVWFGLFYISRDLLLLILYLLLKTVVTDVKIVPTVLGKATTLVFFILIMSLLFMGMNMFVNFLVILNTSLLTISLIFYTRDGYLQWKPKRSKV